MVFKSQSLGIGIQARLSSTRFPKKVLAPLGGKSLLDHVLHQVEKIKQKLLLTTKVTVCLLVPTEEKEEFIPYANKYSTWLIDGPNKDPLQRYMNFLTEGQFDSIMRITSDCPFLSPGLARDLWVRFQGTGADYVRIKTPHPYPDGLDIEVMKAEILRRLNMFARVHNCTKTMEHVTYALNNDPLLLCKREELPAHKGYLNLPKLSVDERVDLIRCEKLLKDKTLWWIK